MKSNMNLSGKRGNYKRIFFTIKQKLALFFVLIFGGILLVGLWSNYQSMKILQREVSESYGMSLDVLQDKFDESMSRMKRLASKLAIDADIMTLNQRPETLEKEYIWDYKELLDQIVLLEQVNNIEADINVILPLKSRIFSSSKGIREVREIDKLLQDMEQIRTGVWVMREKGNYLPEKKSLSIVQSGNSLLDGSSVIVEVDISEETIREMLREFQIQDKGMPFCVNPVSELILYENSYQLSIPAITAEIKGAARDSGELTYFQDRERYRILYQTLKDSDMVFGFVFAETQYLQPVLLVRKLIFIFAFLFFILAFAMISSIHKILLTPLYQLIDAMKKVKEDDLKVRIQIHPDSEMDFVFEQFNSMVERLDYTINEIYRTRITLEKNRLKLLQSQINPHFLYNSLNFIYRMISSENLEGASKMALFLGRYFRYATKSNLDVTTIGEEVANIDVYLQIQQMRYPDKIWFEIGALHEMQDYQIPRLLIQPIVENIFVHGISSFEDKVNVTLDFSETEDGKIHIEIGNDGKKLEMEELKEINDKIHTQMNGHGLNNVYQRLQLFFREEGDLWMECRENNTIVVMEFPAEYKRLEV